MGLYILSGDLNPVNKQSRKLGGGSAGCGLCVWEGGGERRRKKVAVLELRLPARTPWAPPASQAACPPEWHP